jgi:2-haloacid dehalogenase
MAELRALVFDVFGTLVDWRSSVLAEATVAGHRTGREADWAAVVDDWRRAYPPALEKARGEPVWRDLDALQAETLDEVLGRHGVDLPEPERSTLVQSWRRLRPWPDTAAGLERLRTRLRTATLSNGHVALLVDLLRFGGWRVDAVLSAELAASYKPDPVVYRRAAELLGCAPQEVGMVAAHAGDLVAAADVGLRPLFVRRPDEWGTGRPEDPPAQLPGLVVADDLAHLAAQLGC